MACTSNAANFMKVARIVYQLCDYTDFRADFLQTRIWGKWLVFANQVTYNYYANSTSQLTVMWRKHARYLVNMIEETINFVLKFLLAHP